MSKIVDLSIQCNMVKFYLTDNFNPNYYGDDWDDVPYEHNAGEVYEDYYDRVEYLHLAHNYIIITPNINYLNSPYCKNDFKEGKRPFLLIIDEDDLYKVEDSYYTTHSEVMEFSDYLLYKDRFIEIYFEEEFEDIIRKLNEKEVKYWIED